MEMQNNGGSGLSIASMVLGIVALVLSCCFYYISIPCAVVSIILGAISMSGHKPGRGMAIAGIVCSIIALVLAALVVIGVVGALGTLESLSL